MKLFRSGRTFFARGSQSKAEDHQHIQPCHVCQEPHMPVLKKGRAQAKVLDWLTIYFLMNTKLKWKEKEREKCKKKNWRKNARVWKREKQRYETTCCLEGCLSPTRTTNNNQKTKAVGFLNNFVFTSPKKETTLKGVEEFRKHFRATRLQDIDGHIG